MLKSRKVSFLAYALLFLTIGATLLWPQKAAATTGIPFLISFEGKVVKSDGTNIPDGTYNMEFKIYSGTSNTGVGDTLLFTEDWLVGSSQGGVAFTSGTYAKNIGSAGVGTGDSVALSSLNFNQYPLWISVQIGNTASCTITTTFQSNCGGDGEMTPYIQFTSAPYALNSNELGGLTASQFGQLATNQTWTGTNLFQPAVNTAALQVKNASNAVFTVDTSGNNVIIGKAGSQTAVLQFSNQTGGNVVGIQAGASTAAYTLTLPTTAPSINQCLTAGAATATLLTFGPCATGITLQTAYNSSTGGTTPEIVEDSTRTTVDIQGYSGQAADLLDLRAYAAAGLGTVEFGVGPAGNTTVNGTLTVNGTGNSTVAGNLNVSNRINAALGLSVGTQIAGATGTIFGGQLTLGTTGSFNPMLTTYSTNQNLTIAPNGTGSVILTTGATTTTLANSGASIQTATNSATAFQIQNANSAQILAVDTTANKLNMSGDINLSSVANPTSAPTFNSFVASGALTGTYYYTVTYVSPSGETAYAYPASAAISPAAQNVVVNIPTSPSVLVTARKVYRSTSAYGYYQLVGTVNDNTTTTFTDSNVSPGAYAPGVNTTASLQINGTTILNDNAGNNSVTGSLSLGSGALPLGGYASVAIGDAALAATSNGTQNNSTAVGFGALNQLTYGGGTALGYYAGWNVVNGANDTFVGEQAGYRESNGQFYTASTVQNAAAIGAYAQVQSNNTIVLGSVDTPTITVVGATEGSINNSGTATGNSFQVNPLAYNTGTACTTATSAGTTCAAGAFLYGTGTTWTAAMVGDQIIFADGTTANITAYTSATALSLDRSITEASTTYYRIHQIGLQVTTAGSIGIGTSAPTEEMEVYKDVAGSDNSILVQNDAAGRGAYLKATANSNFADVMLNGTGQMWIAGEWGSTDFALQDYTHTLTPFVVTSSSANDSIYVNSVGVGIGTTSVINKLTVAGDGTGLAQVGGSTGCGGNYVAITLGQTATTSSCNNYNILSSPTDPNLYLNAPSTASVMLRVANATIETLSSSAVTISQPTTISAPSGGGTVDLTVNGRIQTYDGTGQGGVWTRNTEFVGDDGGNTGLYNSGWGLYVNTGQAVTIANTISSANNAGKFYIAGGNWYMGYIAGNDIGIYANGTTQIQTGVSGASTSLFLGNGGAGDYIYDNSNATGTGTVLCKAAGGQIVQASSVCANPSSIAYKQNVVPLVNQTGVDPLSIIQQLTPVSFDWKASTGYTAENGGSHDFGFIAQAVNPILPELVHTDANGTITGLNYYGFIPFAIGAAQEEQQEIVAAQNTLSAMAQSLQSASLTITGDGSIQGALSAGSLNVTGDATLNNLTVTGAATVASLAVSGDANILGNLTVNGHIITGGGAPTVQLQSAAGTNASVSVNGNDTSGTITITTGEAYQPPKNGNPAVPAPTSGDETSLTFSNPFGTTPRIIITGNDRKSATLQVYPDQQSTTGFSLGINQMPEPNTTYTFNYFVVQ